MTTPTLPQETIERIHKDTYDFGQIRLETGYSTTISGQKEAYLQGANKEAKKSLPLIEALKFMADDNVLLWDSNEASKWIDKVQRLAKKALENYDKP